MPLNTDVTNPPNSEIKVKDTGPGGGGKPCTVDLFVSWDSKVLNYTGHGPNKGDYCNKGGTGTVHWHMQKCPRKGRKWYVKLERKPGKTKKTYVVACSVDTKNGRVSRPSGPPVPFP